MDSHDYLPKPGELVVVTERFANTGPPLIGDTVQVIRVAVVTEALIFILRGNFRGIDGDRAFQCLPASGPEEALWRLGA